MNQSPLSDEKRRALVAEVTTAVLSRLSQRTGAWPEATPVPQSCACAVGAATTSACGDCRPAEERYRLIEEDGVARIGCAPGVGAVDPVLAALLDHTLLRPDATKQEILELCEEAHCYGFATVCIQPMWVPLAARALDGSRTKVCTVIGFPHGATAAEVKAYETRIAIAQGAREVDMVIPIGALKGGDLRAVEAHIRAVVRSARAGVLTKVILETSYLTDAEKVAASRLAKECGANFVKTSTGFASAGATVEDIRLLRSTVGPSVGVKAAGGIRDTETARKMAAAGASRIGASASVKIVTGAVTGGMAGSGDRY